jgi:hypothetical protein
VSFAGAARTINALAPVLESADPRDVPRLRAILPRAVARHRVGGRPDRYDPRAVKRRAKPIAFLTVPRARRPASGWQDKRRQLLEASGSAIRDSHQLARASTPR